MTLRIAAEGKTVSKQGKFVSNHDVKGVNFSSNSLDVLSLSK